MYIWWWFFEDLFLNLYFYTFPFFVEYFIKFHSHSLSLILMYVFTCLFVCLALSLSCSCSLFLCLFRCSYLFRRVSISFLGFVNSTRITCCTVRWVCNKTFWVVLFFLSVFLFSILVYFDLYLYFSSFGGLNFSTLQTWASK